MNTCTCHTEGCENDGVPVELALSFEMDGMTMWVDVVYCGACGQEITDVVPPIGQSEQPITGEPKAAS
jgi:hypothetical protein